ncbi:aminotransferase class IV [Streptomyces naphthomycinicus]|uniref:aminotransferase class IV n=1 Tax=Streptomyces naphthomycinicus TaxID=2872625 RepID=UPI001CED50C5|nr:aminotransferase class IV [Streptomyces sp. TML10]
MYEENPEVIWWNGRLAPWGEATVHVTSEVATRGTNVFEGLRAYWQSESERHGVVHLERHLSRLGRSARLIRFPAAATAEHIDQLRTGVVELVRALGPGSDYYLRPTVFIEQGRYGWRPDEVRLGSYIAGYRADPTPMHPMTCVVSTWRRTPDASISPLVKVGAAYQAFRLPRIEAAMHGADEAILLNSQDTVAETGGAAIFIVRDATVVTPPLADGVLDSITRRTVIELLRERPDTHVVERSIPRSELYAADEAFLCGTLDEIRAVASIDGVALRWPTGPVTSGVRTSYLSRCRGVEKSGDREFLHFVDHVA